MSSEAGQKQKSSPELPYSWRTAHQQRAPAVTQRPAPFSGIGRLRGRPARGFRYFTFTRPFHFYLTASYYYRVHGTGGISLAMTRAKKSSVAPSHKYVLTPATCSARKWSVGDSKCSGGRVRILERSCCAVELHLFKSRRRLTNLGYDAC